jgi:peptide/nickel transport system substrate-binding protein
LIAPLPMHHGGAGTVMRRRDFLKRTTAAAAGIASANYIHPAPAQSRKNTLLAVSENGPNNLDIMGLGANRPAYEASWNT